MLYVVTGAPAAGKSTWVRAHAEPGDLRFDTDALTNVLTGREPGKHHHDTKSKAVTAAARQAGIDAALSVATERDVYVIHSNLSKDLEAKYRARGAQFVIVDPGEEENLRRCAAHRPGYKQRQVRAWYARRAEWPQDALVVSGFEPVAQDQAVATDADPVDGVGDMANVHVVIGPPAAGKSTFVREHAGPGDVVVDFDLLANALSNQDAANHDHSKDVKMVTKAARAAAVAKACSMGVATWMIHSSPAPSTLDRYAAAGATIHVVDPGKDVVMSRCKRERPPAMLVAAAKWYDDRKPTPPKTTTERGLGWEHQRKREALLAVHRDGAPCWWCSRPMYRDKTRNFDGQALAADHIQARANGGTTAGRLLHGSCNSSRGDGSRDALRPALASHGAEPDPRPDSPPAAPLGPAPALSPAADYEPATVYDWPSL